MGTNYKRGVRLEREVLQEYKDKGYSSVRTAGSHGIFDVISFNGNIVIFTQCKVTKIKPKSDIAKLNKYAEEIYLISLTDVPKCGIKELVVKYDRKGADRILVL